MKRNTQTEKKVVNANYSGGSSLLQRIGATKIGVWVIKHLVSPLDRWVYQRTGGRRVSTGHPLGPLMLLTTTGRRSGMEHTTPVFYLRDGDRLVVCNVNPGFEHPNPWILNLRANPIARVQIGAVHEQYYAREANETEVEHYWPQLVQIWPAYKTHFERSLQRNVFLLEPINSLHASSSG